MIPKLYMDEHFPSAITAALRSRGIDVLTALEDGRTGDSDADLLRRATATGRILVTFDVDFLREASIFANAHDHFAGVIYMNPNTVTLGQILFDLETICIAGTAEEIANTILRLPL